VLSSRGEHELKGAKLTHDWWPTLRAGEMISYLTDEEWGRLQSAMEVCGAVLGDVILKKGSPSRSLLLVEEGELEVFDESMGEMVVLGTVGAGGIVGEVGFVDGRARTHGVRARTDCKLLRLPRASLLELVKGDPTLFAKVTIALAELLAKRFRSAVEELEPVRAFAASLREPMDLGSPVPFDEIDAPLPEPTTEEGADEAVQFLRDLARKARHDLARV
jgi:CRP/FNR family cyclic AMP-dependent transcriptional regulator